MEKIKILEETRFKLVEDFRQYQQFQTLQAHHFHGQIAKNTPMSVSIDFGVVVRYNFLGQVTQDKWLKQRYKTGYKRISPSYA